MSQSVHSGSKKSSQQGILRIFRQSVRELGNRAKADAIKFEHAKLIENKTGYKESIDIKQDTLDDKICSKESVKINDKNNANKKVELKRWSKFRQSASRSWNTSSQKDRFPQISDQTVNSYSQYKNKKDDYQMKDVNKDESELTENTADNFADEQSGHSAAGPTTNDKTCEDKHDISESLNSEFEFENVTENLHTHDKSLLEDWDKEVEKTSERNTGSSRNVQAGLEDSLHELESVKKHVLDETEGCGFHAEVLEEYDINEPKKEDFKAVENSQEHLKSDKKLEFERPKCREKFNGTCRSDIYTYDCSADDVTKTLRESLECGYYVAEDAENKQNFEIFSAGEEIRLEEHLPFHSTPKKVKSETFSNSEVKREFNVDDWDTYLSSESIQTHNKEPEKELYASLSPLTESNFSKVISQDKEGYNSSMGRKKTANINSRDDRCRKTQSHNLLFGDRSSFDLDKPPRFKSRLNEKGKTEQTEKGEGSSEHHRLPEFQDRKQSYSYSKCESEFGQRRFGKSASCDVFQNCSRNTRDFECNDHGDWFQQRGWKDNSENKPLLDLKIKTPEKWKAYQGKNSKNLDDDCRYKAKSPWKMPVSEDWTSEMFDRDLNGESEAYDNVHNCHNLTDGDDFTQKKIDKIIDESMSESGLQERDCNTKMIKQHTDKEQFEKCSRMTNGFSANIMELAERKNDDFSFHSLSLQLPNDKSEAQSMVDNENESSVIKMDSNEYNEKHKRYLPPVPVEVIECGDKENWTNENYVMYGCNTKLNESDRCSESFTINAINLIEAKEENVYDCSRNNIITAESNEKNNTCIRKLIKNDINKIEEHGDEQGVHLKEYAGDIVEDVEHVGVEIDCDTVLTGCDQDYRDAIEEDIGSVTSSNHARRGHENVASEADVSELPFDQRQDGDNGINRLYESEKSYYGKSEEEYDVDAGTFNKRFEQAVFEKDRFNYDQYAMYWYGMDVKNTEWQFGPWHANYPYNYEVYRRWCEQKQYEKNCYSQMNLQDMQYADQMFANYACYCGLPYSPENKKEEIEKYYNRYSCEIEMEGLVSEAKIGSKSGEKCIDRKSHSQNTENKQLRNTFDCDFYGTNDQHKNVEDTHLSNYWSERMHQWVKSQKPEDVNKNNLTGSISDYSSEKKTKGKCTTTFNVAVESKMKPTQSAVVEQRASGVDDKRCHRFALGLDSLKDLESEKNDPDTRDTSHIEKLDISCSCKPSQRLFLVWRLCDCEAGNPPKLQKILSKFDDKSVDLGYQSYESLEHNESTEGKKVGQKAPGFVIQPLWSTPSKQKSTTECTRNIEKGRPKICKAVGDVSISSKNIDKIGPPPGFEHTVDRTLRQKGKTGMKNFRDQKTMSNQEINIEDSCIQLDNQSGSGDTQHKMTLQTPSLKSLIEQQNLQHGPQNVFHPSNTRNKGAISSYGVKQSMSAGISALPFTESDYSKLPVCVSEGAEHLKRAHIAIASAEMSQIYLLNSLKSAVDTRINELQKESHRKDGVEEVEKVPENHRLETTVMGKQTPLKGSELFGASHKEIHHEKVDFEGRKMNTRKDFGRKPHESELEYGCFGSARKNHVDNSRDKQLIDQNLRFQSSGLDSKDESGTSADENNNISVFSQSPELSDDEEVNIRPSEMVEYHSEETGTLKKNKKQFDKRVSNETCYNIKEEEIPVNEMLQMENIRGSEPMKLGKYYKADMEVTNTPRMLYRPRPPCPGFLPPYRGGTHRPHMEHWPMDPRYSLPPPPFRHWPSPVYQMYGAHIPYRLSTCFENEPLSFHPYPKDNKLEEEVKAQTRSRCPQPVPYHSAGRDMCTEQSKNCHSEEKEKSSLAPKQRNALKLVDYGFDSCDESSTDIEPFDCDILCKTAGESHAKISNQLKPTLKKLKTDTDDETSSMDSTDMENNLHASTRTVVKLSRGPTKKLKQKSLKSFSASERQHIHHKGRDGTPKVLKEKTRNRSLSEVIAESKRSVSLSSEKLDTSDSVDVMSQEFPPLGSEQANQSSPLPPLPPFPNSPFWNMYAPGNSSALTGKNEEKQHRRGSSGTIQRKNWQPTSPFRRYYYSPARASSLNSQSETDSEATSFRNDWKTNFKLFHSFGVKYIDTHCHLDFIFSREGFKGSFKTYMDKHSETFPEMFEGCVAVFCNPNTFTPAGGLWLDVAKEPNVWIAMGCHPKMVADFSTAAELGLKKCLRHPKCIALGEIGLDYSGTFYQHAEFQKQVFRRQLRIAIEMAKVLVIHCRQAEDDCLEIMKEMVPPKWKIHCHCFTNGYENAKLWIDAFPNLFIGVTPLVTYKTAKPTHDLARNLPITKLLLETDAPYFVPRCIPREELPLSNPGVAVTVAKEIAQYQELPVAAVLRQCRLNTNFMYGI